MSARSKELKRSKKSILNSLGPGILFASTCIGVSHLVQSTQSGADYGFSLVWVIILANIFKYPFFEFGSRYANATGTSIIEGYRKLGKIPFFLYVFITLITMFFVTGLVTKVTAGFLQNLFQIESFDLTLIILLIVCGGILLIGKYKILDNLIKVIGTGLLLGTLTALLMTLIKGPQGSEPLFSKDWFPGNTFMIALMGWMPTALDLSAWNSLWTVEKMKSSETKPTMKETLFDFNFGYITSMALSLCFVVLGAFLIFGTNNTLGKSAVSFSKDIIDLYASIMGEWSYWIIAVASFSIMFSTAITVYDGYGRSFAKIWTTLSPQKDSSKNLIYRIAICLTIVGGYIVIQSFDKDGFGKLVIFTTLLSLIVAPLIAILNLMLVSEKHLGAKAPPQWLKILAYAGIAFLSFFSIYGTVLLI